MEFNKKHQCLSEERIRTMIREEMSKLIDKTREKVNLPEYYDTEKMEDAIIAIVEYVSEQGATDKVRDHENYYHDG